MTIFTLQNRGFTGARRFVLNTIRTPDVSYTNHKKCNVSYKSFVKYRIQYYTPFTRSKHYLDRFCNLERDPEVVPVYTGHSLFNTTKRITLLLIVQTMLQRNLDNRARKSRVFLA